MYVHIACVCRYVYVVYGRRMRRYVCAYVCAYVMPNPDMELSDINIHMFMDTRIHTYTHTYKHYIYIQAQSPIHACLHRYIHVYAYMHTYAHTYKHATYRTVTCTRMLT